MAANRLLVEDAVEHDDNSVISMNEATLGRLELFRGDTVLIKGKKNRHTVCTVLLEESCPDGRARMNSTVRRNACVRIFDSVFVLGADVPHGRCAHILPIDDSLAGRSPSNLLETHLKPYFADCYRPLQKGDRFTVAGDPLVEFVVVEIDPTPHCVVAPETAINIDGEPIQLAALQRADAEEVGYDDVGGCVRALARLRELVELPLQHPEVFQTMRVPPPRGVLLHGPHGVGKSRMVRALAQETGALLFRLRGLDLASAFDAANRLRTAFEVDRSKMPAIVLIEDVDAIAGRSAPEGRPLAPLLASLIDGIAADAPVVVVATTESPDVVDSSLRRFGRLDHTVEVELPDETGRMEILHILLRFMTISEDVDVEHLARSTPWYSAADLASLCQQAALQCIRERRDVVDVGPTPWSPDALKTFIITDAHFREVLRYTTPGCVVPERTCRTTWTDVGGLDAVKAELLERVGGCIEHSRILEKYGINVPVLILYGPSGCGKSMVMRALANERDIPMLTIEGTELAHASLSACGTLLREQFAKASKIAPCIVFFDHVESLTGAAKELSDFWLEQVLALFDGASRARPVVVVIATSSPDLLPAAAFRRNYYHNFECIFVPMPDAAARESILRAALRRVPVAVDVDLGAIAERLSGCTGAGIVDVCRSASKMAARDAVQREMRHEAPSGGGDILVTRRHFEAAMNRPLCKPDLSAMLRKYEMFAAVMGVGGQAGQPAFAAGVDAAAATQDDDDIYN